MATTNIGGLVNSDSNFNLTRPSAQLIKEYREHKIISLLTSVGAINVENSLQKTGADTVRMFNMLRLDGGGYSGDADRYSNATGNDYGHRDLSIDLLGRSVKYRKTGSVTQQIAAFDLSEGVGQSLKNWIMNMVTYGIINHLGGNSATSIIAPLVSATFTGSTGELALKKVTGMNTVAAPTSTYKAIGAGGVGSVTTDEGIDADNVLKFSDFQTARQTILNHVSGVPLWNVLDQTDYQAIAFVSSTGMNQLKSDAVTQGQGVQLMQYNYAKLAGGQAISMTDFVLDGIRFIEVADALMPRGVHSSTSAAVANTRRAILVGKGALDLAFGAGYVAPTGDTWPGFKVSTDAMYKPLNGEVYVAADALFGCKKVQLYGQGANAATQYDAATYVITHYTAS